MSLHFALLIFDLHCACKVGMQSSPLWNQWYRYYMLCLLHKPYTNINIYSDSPETIIICYYIRTSIVAWQVYYIRIALGDEVWDQWVENTHRKYIKPINLHRQRERETGSHTRWSCYASLRATHTHNRSEHHPQRVACYNIVPYVTYA